MSDSPERRRRVVDDPTTIRDHGTWSCSRCRLTVQDVRFKDLWNRGWRPNTVADAGSRRPPILCPDCHKSDPL